MHGSTYGIPGPAGHYGNAQGPDGPSGRMLAPVCEADMGDYGLHMGPRLTVWAGSETLP
jgi:hypothetical protein